MVDCGELDIANGKVSYTLNTAYNSEATYSCDEGYTLSEATTRKCLDSGDWSGTASFCSSEMNCVSFNIGRQISSSRCSLCAKHFVSKLLFNAVFTVHLS